MKCPLYLLSWFDKHTNRVSLQLAYLEKFDLNAQSSVVEIWVNQQSMVGQVGREICIKTQD